ncbi:hypothetical protein AB0H12_42400 [Actinosynnema sp. NPDC023794]
MDEQCVDYHRPRDHDTPNPVRQRSQVRPDTTYDHTLTVRPLTVQETRAGRPRGRDRRRGSPDPLR